VRETDDAGHLDLFGGSCLLMTRTSLGADYENQRLLAPCVHALSRTLADLAHDPGDRSTRQVAVDRALDILRKLRTLRAPRDPRFAAALTAAGIAVTDLLLFAGVDPGEARAATGEGERTYGVEVPAVGPKPKRPFGALRQRLRR
jgi:hypothetical protein